MEQLISDIIEHNADQEFRVLKFQMEMVDETSGVRKFSLKTGSDYNTLMSKGKQIDKHIVQVKATLQETLDPDVSVFDKIKIQQNSANKMLDCIKDITSTLKSNISDPKNAELVTNVVVEALQNGIKDRLRGDVGKIVTQVRDPQIKEFAKKALGAGQANLIDITKGLTKSVGLDSSRSM
jgi:hypothetical protein